MSKVNAKEKIVALFESDVSNCGFCSREIRKILGISKRRTNEIIAELCEIGYLVSKDPSQKIGKNRGISYVKNVASLENVLALKSPLISALNNTAISAGYLENTSKTAPISALNPKICTGTYINPHRGFPFLNAVGDAVKEDKKKTAGPVFVLDGKEKEKIPFSKNAVDSFLEENVSDKAKPVLAKLSNHQKEIVAEILVKYKSSDSKVSSDEISVTPEMNQPKTETPEPRRIGALVVPPNLKLKGRAPRSHLLKPLHFLKKARKAMLKEEDYLEAEANANVHPRYRNVDPLERDYMFLEEGLRIKKKTDKAPYLDKMPTMIQFASSDARFVRVRKAAHRGRQRADALGATYDNYFWGAFLAIDDGDDGFRYKTYRQKKNFGCEMLEDLFLWYRDKYLGDKMSFNRNDIQTGSPELLPENFVDPKVDPALYDRQIKFYHDVLEECDRMFRAAPYAVDCRVLIPKKYHDIVAVFDDLEPGSKNHRVPCRQQSTALSYPLASESPLACLRFTQISLSDRN